MVTRCVSITLRRLKYYLKNGNGSTYIWKKKLKSLEKSLEKNATNCNRNRTSDKFMDLVQTLVATYEA